MTLGGTFSQPEHLPPEVPKLKKPQEEIERSCQRLAQQRRPPTVPDPIKLSPRVVKPREEIDQSVRRLYDQAMEKRKKQHERAEERSLRESPRVHKASDEEIHESVNRLYNRAMEMHATSNKKLAEKYMFHPEHRKLESLADANEKLYTSAVRRREETRQKLLQKYVAATEVKCKKLTAEEIAASGVRLCQKGGSP